MKDSQNSAAERQVAQCKVDKGCELTLPGEGRTDGQQARGPVLNTISQGTANQDHNATPFTPTRTAVIYKMGNEKCRQGRGDSGALMFCWWEREMVQPPWKTV